MTIAIHPFGIKRVVRQKPAWSPWALTSSLVAWWSAEDLVDGAVAGWMSRVGGFNPVQATGANQPIRAATSFNTLYPGVTFDGTNDELTLASTTGLPTGTTLTASGQIESNVPGIVIEDKDVTGAIVLSSNADGAIIRRCRITTNTFVGIYIIGASDVLIEDCEITTSSPSGSKAITLEDCTGAIVQRCNMHHCEDGVFMNGSGHQILKNYIHDMASGGADPHFDCIQLVGGTTSDVLIRGNYLDGNTGPGASSAITMGAVQDITVRDNYITGGGYGLSMDDRFPPAAAPMENMVVTNNRFGSHVFGPVTVEESLGEWTTGELTWSGNVVDATGAAIAKP